MSDVQIVMDALQDAYGDASQTVLDRRAAEAALKALRSVGWASPDEVCTLVASAGGRIVLDDRYLRDPPAELFVCDDPATMRRVVMTR